MSLAWLSLPAIMIESSKMQYRMVIPQVLAENLWLILILTLRLNVFNRLPILMENIHMEDDHFMPFSFAIFRYTFS